MGRHGRYGRHVHRDVLTDLFSTKTIDVYYDASGTKTVIQRQQDMFGTHTTVRVYRERPTLHVDVDPVTPALAIFALGAMVGGGEKVSAGVQRMKGARSRKEYWDGARDAGGGAVMLLAVATVAVGIATLAVLARPRQFRFR